MEKKIDKENERELKVLVWKLNAFVFLAGLILVVGILFFIFFPSPSEISSKNSFQYYFSQIYPILFILLMGFLANKVVSIKNQIKRDF